MRNADKLGNSDDHLLIKNVEEGISALSGMVVLDLLSPLLL